MIARFLLLVLTTCGWASPPSFVVGIAGGSGSGKSTIAQKLLALFPEQASLISQDAYYKDLSHLPFECRGETNFDHPHSLDFDLLRTHLEMLKRGDAIDIPTYDFCTHARTQEVQHMVPSPIIIVEGILLFAMPEIRDLCDIKIYVDTDDDIRLLRRVGRDMLERARTFEQIREQYLRTVKPMHDAFVEPSKKYADVIIPTTTPNARSLDFIVSRLREQTLIAHGKDEATDRHPL